MGHQLKASDQVPFTLVLRLVKWSPFINKSKTFNKKSECSHCCKRNGCCFFRSFIHPPVLFCFFQVAWRFFLKRLLNTSSWFRNPPIGTTLLWLTVCTYSSSADRHLSSSSSYLPLIKYCQFLLLIFIASSYVASSFCKLSLIYFLIQIGVWPSSLG